MDINIKKKMNKKALWLFVLLIANFKIYYFSDIKLIDTVFDIGKVVSFAIIFFLICIKVHRKTFFPSKFSLLIVLSQIVYLIATIFNEGDLPSAIMTAGSTIYFVLSIEYFLVSAKYSLIDVLFFIFELLIYSNFFSMLLFPDGLYPNSQGRAVWLLGHTNNLTLYVMPAILLSVIQWQIYIEDMKKLKQVRIVLLTIISVLTIFIAKSFTSIIGLLIIVAVWLINLYNIKFKTSYGFVFGVIVFVLISVVKIQSLIGGFLWKYFHKSVTLSGRTVVWDNAISYISQKPLLGYGEQFSSVTKNHLGFDSPHNRLLNLLYVGGIINLIIQSIAMLLAVKKLDRSKRNVITITISGILWALFIQMQLESYLNPIFFLSFIFAYYSSSFELIGWTGEYCASKITKVRKMISRKH